MGFRDTLFGKLSGDDSSTLLHSATSANTDYVPGEILVQFAPGSASNGLHLALGQVNGNVMEDVGGHSAPGLVRVSIGNGMTVEKAIEILSHNPNVQFAEPNYILHADLVSNDPLYTGGSMISRILPSTVNAGALHFIVSSASGAAEWTRARTWPRIDCAKGAALAI